jgi:hypothetical protein
MNLKTSDFTHARLAHPFLLFDQFHYLPYSSCHHFQKENSTWNWPDITLPDPDPEK